ncbi:MAG: hypothetical protein ACPG7F_00370, partial [Aggregatilineales bacterium]
MVNKKISQIIEIKRGDTSGVDALTEAQQATLEANAALEQIAQTDVLSNFGASAADVEYATIQLESMTAQASLLESQIVETYTELGKLDKASPDYEKQEARLARLTEQYAKYIQRIEQVPEKLKEQASFEARIGNVRQETGNLGDAESGIRTVSGAVGVFGGETGGEIEKVLNAGAEIFAVAEALPLLKESLTETFSKVSSSFITTGAAATAAGTGAQGATVSLGAMAAAAAPFLIIGAGLAAIFGGLTLATQANAAAAEEAREQVEKTVASIRLENQTRLELNRALESGDTDGVRNRIEQLQQEIELGNANLLDLLAQRQQAQEAYDNASFDVFQQALSGTEEAFAVKVSEFDTLIADLNDNDLSVAREELALLVDSIQAIEEAEAAREAINDNVRQIEVRARAEQELARIVESGTREQLDTRRKAIEEEIAYIESVLPEYEKLAHESEEAAATAEDYRNQLEDLGIQQSILGDSAIQLAEAQEAQTEAITAQLSAIDARIAREIELQDLMENATVEQVTDRLKAIEREEAAIEKMLPQLNALAGESEEAAEKLSEYRGRLRELASETGELETDVLPEAQMRAQQELLRETADAEAESAKKIIAIRNEMADRLVALEEKRTQQEEQAAEKRDDAIKQIIGRSTKAIAKENQSFMADSRKAAEQFRRDEIQRVKDYNDERLQILDDLNSSLASAEESNNVVAFIRAQQESEKRLSEVAAESEEEAALRTADFIREQEERRVEHESRVEQIRLEAQEAQIAQQEAYEARLLQIDEQAQKETEKLREQAIAKAQAEEAALEERLAKIRQSYAQEEAMISARTAKEAEAQKKREGQYEEHQDKLLQTRAEAEVAQAETEADTATELAKAKADIEQQQIQQFGDATVQAFGKIFDAVSQGAQRLVGDLQRQIQQAQQSAQAGRASSSRPSSGRSSSPQRNSKQSVPRRRTRFANEG